jgi:hypothetical protein
LLAHFGLPWCSAEKTIASAQSVDYHNFTSNRGVVATVSHRSKVLLIALALLAATLLPACYTLFRHPRLAQLNYQRPEDNRCKTCHSSQELWDFTHPATLPPQVGPWGEFYDRPWWYQRRWKTGANEEGRTGAERDSLATPRGGS